ncbi:hypothetical protein IF1G_03947 [Cordyceps javanica]|uniref:Secreted protein n=1 Tax=Cordyceps javanica TaxID=43265 RepID=A0A545V4R2_9HYPO|nr:hypothetical protein IF1G_03947 [Cordyceps javanica]
MTANAGCVMTLCRAVSRHHLVRWATLSLALRLVVMVMHKTDNSINHDPVAHLYPTPAMFCPPVWRSVSACSAQSAQTSMQLLAKAMCRKKIAYTTRFATLCITCCLLSGGKA